MHFFLKIQESSYRCSRWKIWYWGSKTYYLENFSSVYRFLKKFWTMTWNFGLQIFYAIFAYVSGTLGSKYAEFSSVDFVGWGLCKFDLMMEIGKYDSNDIQRTIEWIFHTRLTCLVFPFFSYSCFVLRRRLLR